jgi:L-2-hydroxyglutarate oxidase LhgO
MPKECRVTANRHLLVTGRQAAVSLDARCGATYAPATVPTGERMTTLQTDTIVIGAGVIGLAIARALALRGREVIVLERGERIGAESSGRNSGVIHAGIYYPEGSLKARLCVRGRELLYAFLRNRGIAHARCGKLVVGSASERAALDAIRARAQACGVTDIQVLDASAIREREPAVRANLGLFSPATGIVDTPQFLLALQADLEAAGGTVVGCRWAARRPRRSAAPRS